MDCNECSSESESTLYPSDDPSLVVCTVQESTQVSTIPSAVDSDCCVSRPPQHHQKNCDHKVRQPAKIVCECPQSVCESGSSTALLLEIVSYMSVAKDFIYHLITECILWLTERNSHKTTCCHKANRDRENQRHKTVKCDTGIQVHCKPTMHRNEKRNECKKDPIPALNPRRLDKSKDPHAKGCNVREHCHRDIYCYQTDVDNNILNALIYDAQIPAPNGPNLARLNEVRDTGTTIHPRLIQGNQNNPATPVAVQTVPQSQQGASGSENTRLRCNRPEDKIRTLRQDAQESNSSSNLKVKDQKDELHSYIAERKADKSFSSKGSQNTEEQHSELEDSGGRRKRNSKGKSMEKSDNPISSDNRRERRGNNNSRETPCSHSNESPESSKSRTRKQNNSKIKRGNNTNKREKSPSSSDEQLIVPDKTVQKSFGQRHTQSGYHEVDLDKAHLAKKISQRNKDKFRSDISKERVNEGSRNRDSVRGTGQILDSSIRRTNTKNKNSIQDSLPQQVNRSVPYSYSPDATLNPMEHCIQPVEQFFIPLNQLNQYPHSPFIPRGNLTVSSSQPRPYFNHPNSQSHPRELSMNMNAPVYVMQVVPRNYPSPNNNLTSSERHAPQEPQSEEGSQWNESNGGANSPARSSGYEPDDEMSEENIRTQRRNRHRSSRSQRDRDSQKRSTIRNPNESDTDVERDSHRRQH